MSPEKVPLQGGAHVLGFSTRTPMANAIPDTYRISCLSFDKMTVARIARRPDKLGDAQPVAAPGHELDEGEAASAWAIHPAVDAEARDDDVHLRQGVRTWK